MQITPRTRWEHATRATKTLAGWKVRAIESVVVAGGTYYGLRHLYSQGETMPHMLALAIATGVGLVVFPVFEFASHYLDAPRAIELAELRTDNRRLRAAHPASPTVPGRAYVQEPRAWDVMDRLGKLKWTERVVVAKASYIGWWVRWKGEIAHVMEHQGNAGYAVLLWNDRGRGGPMTTLRFLPAERHIVVQLEAGQKIEYEGEIVGASENDMFIENVTVRQLDT